VILSGAAGYCEEFLFRGFLFNIINENVGLFPAFTYSSIAFGLLHFPLFGVSTIVETLFGAVFAYAYWISGYNIAVPIVTHALFDAILLIFSWDDAKRDLTKRIEQAKDMLVDSEELEGLLPGNFALVAKGVSALSEVILLLAFPNAVLYTNENCTSLT